MLAFLDKNTTSLPTSREKLVNADIDARLKGMMTAHQNLTQSSNTIAGESVHKLGDFRTSLPGELRTRYDELSSIIANGDGARKVADLATQAGDKIAPIAGTTAREVKNVAGKAIDAVKTGDTWEILSVAKDAGIKVEQKAKTVLEQAQSAGMWAMIWNAVKSVAEGVSGLFQSFGEIIKKLFAMLAGFFGFKGLSGDAASEAIGKVGDKIEKTKDTIVGTVDPLVKRRQEVAEALKKAPEDIKNKLETDLAQWGYSTNDRVKGSKFNEVWNQYKPEIEQLLKTNQDAALYDTRHNPLDSLIKSITIPTRMFVSLIARGVIPMSAITTQVYQGAIVLSLKSLRGMMQFWNDQMEGVLSKIDITNFENEKKWMNVDEQAILNQIFVHNHVIGSYLLSIAGNAIAKAGAYTFAWQEWVGIHGLIANYRGVQGEWAKSVTEMQKIATSIGATDDLAKIGVAQRNMQLVFEETITKGFITDAFNKAKDPTDFLKKMQEIQSVGKAETLFSQKYFEKITQEVFKTKTLPTSLPAGTTLESLSVPLRQQIGATLLQTRDIWKFDSMKSSIVGAFSRTNTPVVGAHFIDNVQGSLDQVNRSMATSIEYKAEGKWFGLILDRIKQAVRPSAFTEIAKNAQKGIISVQLEDAPQAIKAISNLAYESPGLVSSFFKLFPLVVVGTSTVMADDKIKGLQAGMIGLTPIIGPLILIHEGWEMKGLKFTNVSLIGLWVTQLTIESVMLLNILRSSRGCMDVLLKSAAFVGRPVTMMVDAAKWAGQLMSISRQAVSTIARGGGGEMLRWALRTNKGTRAWLAIGAMAVATAVVAYGPEKLLNEIDGARSVEFMAKEGYIHPDGGLNIDLVKEKFAGFSADQRKKVVEYIAFTSFGSDYSIDQKSGTKILVNGAVDLETIKSVQTELASILGEKTDINVSLSDTGIKSWYELLKRESKDNIPAIKDTMMASLHLSADELQKKVPDLFKA
jgi:hypothetical protein